MEGLRQGAASRAYRPASSLPPHLQAGFAPRHVDPQGACHPAARLSLHVHLFSVKHVLQHHDQHRLDTPACVRPRAVAAHAR